MSYYLIEMLKDQPAGPVMRLAFGKPASNDLIVPEAVDLLEKLAVGGQLDGGPVLRIDGPASMPVMAVIIHKVAHLYGAIAIRDPKLGRFVVSISHHPDYPLGALIE